MPETKSEQTNIAATGCTVFAFAILAVGIAFVHFFYNYTDYGFLIPGHSEFFWGCLLVAAGLFGYGWYLGNKQEKLQAEVESDDTRKEVEDNVKNKLKDF